MNALQGSTTTPAEVLRSFLSNEEAAAVALQPLDKFNFGVPSGRPVWVLSRMASASADEVPAAR
jgi:hypothetical protein